MKSLTSKIAVRLAAISLLGATTSSAFSQVKVDKNLPTYTSTKGVSGNLKSIGSDTMNNEMALWAEGFRSFYPNVQVEIEGKGSSTAPPALIAGTSHFGPMSRPMKGQEIDAFVKKYGYEPTSLNTSIDMLAVYVHKDNPIAKTGLTLQQVDAIFSSNRRGGLSKAINTWGELGLTGEWADKPISLYGRNSASGTYGFFKDVALFGGDFRNEVKEQPGSSSVVQGVANDKYAIGYSGIGYMTADVRAVPLATSKGEAKFEPNAESAYSGEYPLSRFLIVYTNIKPGKNIDPLRREFIRYIFSKQGQEAVIRDGYYPVPQTVAQAELKKIGIE